MSSCLLYQSTWAVLEHLYGKNERNTPDCCQVLGLTTKDISDYSIGAKDAVLLNLNSKLLSIGLPSQQSLIGYCDVGTTPHLLLAHELAEDQPDHLPNHCAPEKEVRGKTLRRILVK